MDTYSSGEDPLIKIRKPYTITKQRERWTEEEHNRFLEALKLHGRAWQCIEDHIGTKTAVQIRSHAQKFFSKLEKDAQAKGVPVNEALDIDIPPPRPKRKLSNPYPRKTGDCSSSTLSLDANEGKLVTSLSSPQPGNPILDLERVQIPKKPFKTEEPAKSKETRNENGSEVFSIDEEAPCTSLSAENKHSKPISVPLNKPCPFREFVPMSKGLDKSGIKEIALDNGANKSQGKEIENQATQNHPTHVPFPVLEGSLGTSPYQESVLHQGIHGHPNYQSFVQFSSAFSSSMISALLQNPAAHASASFAASLCPSSSNARAFAESSGCALEGGFPPLPSMGALAAATVAAATAWWAAHGLLPVCVPAFATDTSPMDNVTGQETIAKAERMKNTSQDQPIEKENSNPLSSYSADSEENGHGKLDNMGSKSNEQDKDVINEINDSNKPKGRKQVDRSSCGSNTPSSSEEVETDALENHEKVMEESNEPDTANPASDSMNRRIRNTTNNLNESWKEVSEEGKVAFQALFTRQILPQSFLPNIFNIEKEKDEDPLLLDLNNSDYLTAKNGGEEEEEGMLTIGIGHGKQKACRIGFKPYKRCPVEAKESNAANTSFEGDEKCPKRIRIDGRDEALS